ncbi:MAG: homoserine kinase [Polyangiaceae bacterium]|nr:homoserine kinase [Polyangiaceae bacterium]
MAVSAVLTLEDAGTIVGHYGLRVVRAEPVDGGRVNSNFRLWTGEEESFFLRIYEQQCASAVQDELRLVRELEGAGVPTPAPLARVDGGWVCEHSGKPAAVFPWIRGEWICQRSVTPQLCRAVGTALARLHEASRVCQRAPPGRYDVQALRGRLDVVSATGTHELASAAAAVRRKLEVYAAVRDVGLPSGIIHGDLFRENVLWNGDSVAAMVDFECACCGPFAYDLMVSVLAWCYDSSFEWPFVRGMLEGYAAHRLLSRREIRALAVEGAVACLRFVTTRISDFSMHAGPAGPKRDYRRFLQRLAELEAGASQELANIATETRNAGETPAAQQEREP